jgi:sulfite reductase beta subunit-like hemoprotein
MQRLGRAWHVATAFGAATQTTSHIRHPAPLSLPKPPRLQTMAPGTKLGPAVHVAHDTPWERRDLLGVHPQKQEGLNWVGVSVPSGRITAQDLEVRPGA